MREVLDPAFGSEVMLPPDELLISDLTTPTWRITVGPQPKIQSSSSTTLSSGSAAPRTPATPW
ncbi:hypothetical protein [Nonomuraea sp. NPDC049400]|uniref:hypothetical protein n=1 Tax=Nonomuraea sp. NPDC049400 TaxID=3364352 RepID=UPI0037B9F855